jgi:hypothetical protein
MAHTLSLLRARYKRPCRGNAANDGDELPPPEYEQCLHCLSAKAEFEEYRLARFTEDGVGPKTGHWLPRALTR